jgi:hypothetical protein
MGFDGGFVINVFLVFFFVDQGTLYSIAEPIQQSHTLKPDPSWKSTIGELNGFVINVDGALFFSLNGCDLQFSGVFSRSKVAWLEWDMVFVTMMFKYT